ncbi:unnamed protein product [Cylindrotheca closterium]|uniref:Uncharacterized protein n=1 Tax=Cylindrotheca closterium TaxID=2856 RepID=A0AAD2GC12_9STRA|nr:unnamed protein product [Cylindrotheca closterium]
MIKAIFIWFSLIFVCAALSATSGSGATELERVRTQLGYVPTNFISVSAWKSDLQQPIAIRTYPLNGGAKRRQSKAGVPGQAVNSPFPTLYWLTCPDISKAIADLEGRGYLKKIEASIRESSELTNKLVQCHIQYAEERWNSLTEKDQQLLSDSNNPSIERMRIMMRDSGVSGTNFTMYTEGVGTEMPSIKCLHAHYAHYVSTKDTLEFPNPVGAMVHEALQKCHPEVDL